MKKHILLNFRILFIGLLLTALNYVAFSQQVDIRKCPALYKRNNGNGQKIDEFAPNISPSSIYYLSALSQNNQGNFSFGWAEPILYPPVITKTWITPTGGDTYLDWEFGNNNSGSPFNPPGIPNITEVKYTFHNFNLPTVGIIAVEFSDPQDGLPICLCSYSLINGSLTEEQLSGGPNQKVSSGSDGGLESRSLGTAIVEQTFERFSEGNTALNYQRKETFANFKSARINGLELAALVPDEQTLGSEFKGYITSPTELIDITNAEEVISVDYLSQGFNKATFFATQTSGQVYEHSKYVCDRLKGSTIMAIDSIQIENFYLIRSLLKPISGSPEYSVSFSIGMGQNSTEFHIQSAWLLEEYQPEDQFFNFQFWSADAKLLQTMIEDVIHQMKGLGNLSQTVDSSKPGIFVSKTQRKSTDPSKVELTIWNRTLETSATIQLTAKANEITQSPIINTLDVDLLPMSSSIIEIDAKDYAELAIDLLDKVSKKDYLFESDGIWAHYLPEGGQLLQYNIVNDSELAISEGEFPVWRNVEFSSSGSNYATIYKTLKGGAVPADLSGYSFLNFQASGTGKLTIRLLKKSIDQFESHYSFSVDLRPEITTYSLPIENFRSTEFSQKANLDDLVILSFTSENQGNIEINLKGIRFSNKKEVTLSGTETAKIYPNPFQEKTNLLFESRFGGNMEMSIYSIDSGNLIQSQVIDAKPGQNQKELNFGGGMKKGLYILKLSSNLEMITAKLLVE